LLQREQSNNQGVRSTWKTQEQDRFELDMAKQRHRESQAKVELVRRQQRRRAKKMKEKNRMKPHHQQQPKAMGFAQILAAPPANENDVFIIGTKRCMQNTQKLKEFQQKQATSKKASKKSEAALLNLFRKRIQDKGHGEQKLWQIGMQIFLSQYLDAKDFKRACKEKLGLDLKEEQIEILFGEFVSNIDGQLNVKKMLVTMFPENEVEAWMKRTEKQDLDKHQNYEMELDEIESIRKPGIYSRRQSMKTTPVVPVRSITAKLQLLMEGGPGGSRARVQFMQQLFDPECTGFISPMELQLGLGKIGYEIGLTQCVSMLDALPTQDGCVDLKKWNDHLESEYEKSQLSEAQYIGLGFDRQDGTTGPMCKQGKGKNNTMKETIHSVAAMAGLDESLPNDPPKRMVPDGMRSQRASVPWAVDQSDDASGTGTPGVGAAAAATAAATTKSKKVQIRADYTGGHFGSGDMETSLTPRPADLIRLRKAVVQMAKYLEPRISATYLISPTLLRRHGKQHTLGSFKLLLRTHYNLLLSKDDGRSIWKLCKGQGNGRAASAMPRTADLQEDSRPLDFQKFVGMIVQHIHNQGDKTQLPTADKGITLPTDLPSDSYMGKLTDRQLDLVVKVGNTAYQRPVSAAPTFSMPYRPAGNSPSKGGPRTPKRPGPAPRRRSISNENILSAKPKNRIF
jgi:Ca2+-binding EF-hand superfamily protein